MIIPICKDNNRRIFILGEIKENLNLTDLIDWEINSTKWEEEKQLKSKQHLIKE